MCRDGMWVASRFFVEMTIYRGGFIYISSSRAGEMKSWQIELRCDEKWISGWASQRSFFFAFRQHEFMNIVVFFQVNETLRFTRMKREEKSFPFFYCNFTISNPLHHHMVHPQFYALQRCSGKSAKVFIHLRKTRTNSFAFYSTAHVSYWATIHQHLSINYANVSHSACWPFRLSARIRGNANVKFSVAIWQSKWAAKWINFHKIFICVLGNRLSLSGFSFFASSCCTLKVKLHFAIQRTAFFHIARLVSSIYH